MQRIITVEITDEEIFINEENYNGISYHFKNISSSDVENRKHKIVEAFGNYMINYYRRY